MPRDVFEDMSGQLEMQRPIDFTGKFPPGVLAVPVVVDQECGDEAQDKANDVRHEDHAPTVRQTSAPPQRSASAWTPKSKIEAKS